MVPPKTIKVIIKWYKESCQPNPGLNPSKINRARKDTIKMAKILGK
jgi:hypothetical protein